jgi:membrane-bound ClpP family serine protease
LTTYLLTSLPGWLVATLFAWIVARTASVPSWILWTLVAVWVAKDLATYPAMRRFYTPAPSARRMVGREGSAVTVLAPDGFVRVHGELWQARLRSGRVGPGERVRVRDIDGLLLFVDAADAPVEDPPRI